MPHSEIRGSKVTSTSPRLIAGNHVLLRLSVPRHSPYALFRLNSRSLFSYTLSSSWEYFSFFCLSFANNCFLGCKLKDLLIHTFLFVRSRLLSTPDEIVPTNLYGKTFKNFSNKFFSIYNYLFRFFFFIRFSMSMLLSLKRKVTKETLHYSFYRYSAWWR